MSKKVAKSKPRDHQSVERSHEFKDTLIADPNDSAREKYRDLEGIDLIMSRRTHRNIPDEEMYTSDQEYDQ